MSSVAIVEDEPYIAMSLAKLVKACELNPTLICGSGEEFIEQVTEKEFSLVLIDINLKGQLTGIDVAKLLRSRSNCPIIFLSGMLSDYKTEIMNISNCSILEKPFNFSQAREMIKQVTAR